MDLAKDTAAALQQAAEHYGTPLYVYDMDKVVERCTLLKESLPREQTVLLYAMKANSNPEILKLIIQQGFGVDCVSLGEVLMALRLGAQRILYTNNNVAASEFTRVIALSEEHKGVIWINCDSIQRIAELPKGSKCFIRVNGPVGGGHHHHVITCGPESKFGIPHEYISEAIRVARDASVQIVGLHQHIGSGVLDADKFAAAIEVLAGVLRTHAAELGDVEYVNFGGGIGVPYRPTQSAIDLKHLGSAIDDHMKALRAAVGKPSLQLVLEPGRFPVAESGYLLATVNTIKGTPYNRTYLGVDTGFNHLIRPCMYGSYHHISNVTAALRETTDTDTARAAYFVAGNVCESGDVFTRGSFSDIALAKDVLHLEDSAVPSVSDPTEENIAVPRVLPTTHVGDLLAFHTAGAYGFSMSSEYNTRPRPAEVGFTHEGGKAVFKLLRKAKSYEEIVEEALASCT